MNNDVICFSHLRWNFVYQRPQHLMTRFARTCRVFYVEEPVFTLFPDKLTIRVDKENSVFVVTPELEEGENPETFETRMGKLVDQLLVMYSISDFVAWYYFPMAYAFTLHLKPIVRVYDCMDELSAFKNAPARLIEFEQALFQQADLVFTGGVRLYEAKKQYHHAIYPFPSAIDKTFFYPARSPVYEAEDQSAIPHPRLGFFGVIDERFDIELVARMAVLKPDWQFIFIGPVVKIDADALPRYPNIHYLGMKEYKVLPKYIAGWDLCIMPFAINASTEFISPTKTPEFLAAGKRVISTPIHDVVHPYGDKKLVHIASTAEEFVSRAEEEFAVTDHTRWLGKVDEFLSTVSWEKTWKAMQSHIEIVIEEKRSPHPHKVKSHV